MNLEVVKFDPKDSLYQWPITDDLQEYPGPSTRFSIGVVETREILTYITTKIIDNTRAVSVIRGILDKSIVELLNMVCSYCNNRATTITEHSFYIPSKDGGNVAKFLELYDGARMAAFTSSTEAEFDGEVAIIHVCLTYPE